MTGPDRARIAGRGGQSRRARLDDQARGKPLRAQCRGGGAIADVNGDAKVNRENFSQNGIVSLFGPLVPAGQNFTIQPITDYYTGFDASWELDLWGHVRRQVESADADRPGRASSSGAALWCRRWRKSRATISPCAARRRSWPSPATI